MPHTGGTVRLDEAIARLASRQHGVVARRQLIAAGASRGAIRHRLETKRLHPVHADVYSVGHARLLPYARYMAAVLACGQGTVLSHRHAAALLGLLTAGSRQIEVTTPRLGAGSRQASLSTAPAASLPKRPPPASAFPARVRPHARRPGGVRA